MPSIFCFCPTTGAAFLKGKQRVMGTLLGAALSAFSLRATQGNGPALVAHLFIVSALAKYLSIHGPLRGYAGLIVGVTWCILVLADWKDGSSDRVRDIVLWRNLLTFCGVCYVVVMSLLVIPNHATRLVEVGICDVLIGTTDICMIALESLLPSNTPLPSFTVESQKEKNRKSVEELQASLANTKKLIVEAEGEWYLVKRRVTNLQGLQNHMTTLVNLTAVCNSIAESAAQTCKAGASEYYLQKSKGLGKNLEQDIASCISAMRHFVRSATSVLQGSKQGRDSQKFARAHEDLLSTVFAVRRVAWDEGAFDELQQQGLDNFMAMIYSIDEFFKECMQVEAVIFGSLPPATERSDDLTIVATADEDEPPRLQIEQTDVVAISVLPVEEGRSLTRDMT